MLKKEVAVAPMRATANCPACAKELLVIVDSIGNHLSPIDCNINSGRYYKHFLCNSCKLKFPIKWIDGEPVPMVNPSNKLNSFMESFNFKA